MWIALNNGFISVVTADMARLPKRELKFRRTGEFLCVRARNPAHLRALFPGFHIYQWKGRDYPARIFIDRADFSDFMRRQSDLIDYGNFKDSVDDDELHDAYMAVWSVMHRYGFGAFRRAQPQPRLPFMRTRVKGDPINDEYERDDRSWPIQSEPTDRLQARKARDAGWGVDYPLEDGSCGLLGCTADHPCMQCLTRALTHENERQLGAEPDRYGDFDERDDEGAKSHLRVPPK